MKALLKNAVLILCIMFALSIIPVQQESVLAASSVSINKKEATIWVNNYENLEIIGTDNAVTWKSSDTKVAVVSSSGKVTGVEAGKATITATVSKKKFTCKVTVKRETDTSCLQAFLDDISADHGEDDYNEILGIKYNAVKDYKLLDINADGVYEVLLDVKAENDIYTVLICTVKNGAVTLAGDLEINKAYLDYDKGIYYNKKYHELTVQGSLYEWGKKSEFYWAYYINNGTLSRYDSRFIARSGDEYFQTPLLKSSTKNKYIQVVNKYYNSSDMTGIISVASNEKSTWEVNDIERKSIVEYALQAENTPYVWGGTDLSIGVDCSGFVQAVYKKLGYVLPGTSREQVGVCEEFYLYELLPGDLIFYANKSGTVNHVGIYIGDGQMIHAKNAREGVVIDDIYYATPYSVGRIITD